MLFVLAMLLAAPQPFKVEPKTGTSNFSAIFEAPLGERINAISNNVECALTYDDAAGMLSGSCKVPLASIMVDNTPLKSDHFHAWAANDDDKKKIKACNFEVKLDPFPLKLEANKEVAFSVQAPFTVCGRSREDHGKEQIDGTVVLMPAGTRGPTDTLRIRAHIAKFDREAYHVGPKWTDGWLAKVQNLASVVAAVGSVDVTAFAEAPAPKK